MTIYFIQAGAIGPVKIGCTKTSSFRLKILQCAHYEELKLIRELEGGFKLETWFHKQFHANHIRGEWFTFDPLMLTLLPPPAPVILSIPSKKEKIIDDYKTIVNFTSVAKKYGYTKEYIRRVVTAYEKDTGITLGRRKR